MGDNGAKAQRDQARAQSRAYKRQAGIVAKDAAQQADIFVEQANQQLSLGTGILGKAERFNDYLQAPNAPAQTGIDVGAAESAEVAGLRKDAAYRPPPEVVADVNPNQGQVDNNDSQMNSGGQTGGVERVAGMAKAKKAQKTLDAIASPFAGVKDVSAPEQIGRLSGSDLLGMSTFRDQLQRDRNALIRKGQEDAYAHYESGVQAGKQADYYNQAYQTSFVKNILGGALTAATMGAGFIGGGGGFAKLGTPEFNFGGGLLGMFGVR